MVSFLEGRRTYILSALAAVGAFLHAMGWLPPEQWTTLLGILTPLVLMALRAGVAKVETQVAQVQTAMVVQTAHVDAKLARVEQQVTPPTHVPFPPPRPPWPRRAP